jgi:hypothetical protein
MIAILLFSVLAHGGCHIGKMVYTSAFVIFKLSMLFLVCVPIFIEIGW